MIRDEPLETMVIDHRGEKLTLPTPGEMLRIKAVLILRRNATRDYLDFVALADHLGDDRLVAVLQDFDRLYPQPNGQSALQQLEIQLANPMPYDLEEMNLSEYKNLHPRWQDWQRVKAACVHCATVVFDRTCEETKDGDG
jgi:hypothetical protein